MSNTPTTTAPLSTLVSAGQHWTQDCDGSTYLVADVREDRLGMIHSKVRTILVNRDGSPISMGRVHRADHFLKRFTQINNPF